MNRARLPLQISSLDGRDRFPDIHVVLVLNGIEAMRDRGGVLTFNSRLGKDSQIEISVNDTGQDYS
jgi:hypothetical protein